MYLVRVRMGQVGFIKMKTQSSPKIWADLNERNNLMGQKCSARVDNIQCRDSGLNILKMKHGPCNKVRRIVARNALAGNACVGREPARGTEKGMFRFCIVIIIVIFIIVRKQKTMCSRLIATTRWEDGEVDGGGGVCRRGVTAPVWMTTRGDSGGGNHGRGPGVRF